MNDETHVDARRVVSPRRRETKCRVRMRVSTSAIVIALAWARVARSAIVRLDLRQVGDRERWRDTLAEVEVAAYAYSLSNRTTLAGLRALERVERTSSDQTKVRFDRTSLVFALASNESLGAKVSTSFEEFFFAGTKLRETDVPSRVTKSAETSAHRLSFLATRAKTTISSLKRPIRRPSLCRCRASMTSCRNSKRRLLVCSENNGDTLEGPEQRARKGGGLSEVYPRSRGRSRRLASERRHNSSTDV